MARRHQYELQVTWTGNAGTGTSGYRDYRRSYDIECAGKPAIAGSSDRTFRGDETRWNPEDLLVAALSACHQLAYLHLCADAGIIVTAYEDKATGIMESTTDGSGHFVSVTLHPVVTLAAGSDAERAQELHHGAHQQCFIANSVNFPVHCEPSVQVEELATA
jgi:organic hydroperoxide reductase OsmC/OhrA